MRTSYLNSRSKDAKILLGISKLSLSERWKSIQELKAKLVKAEATLAKKRAKTERTPKEDRGIVADEDGIFELKYRLKLEESEYKSQKAISPDFVEPS